MTDRLKEWLDAPYRSEEREAKALAALRAVVELHATGIDGRCVWCSSLRDSPDVGPTAPCATIRAIEKEVLP